jgi:arylsulfatase A-like enzyme
MIVFDDLSIQLRNSSSVTIIRRAMVTDPSRRGLGERVSAGLLGGWIASSGASLIDALVSWRPAAQFLPGFGERLGLLGYQVASAGLVGAAIGVVLVGAFYVLGRTRLGDLYRALTTGEGRTLSIAALLSAPPVLYVVASSAYLFTIDNLATRRHAGLQLGTAMLIGIVALIFALVMTLVVSWPVERLLVELGRRRPRFGRILNSRRTLPIVFAAMIVTMVIGGVVMLKDTLALLPLRGAYVAIGALVLAAPGLSAGRVYARALGRRHLAVRLSLPVIFVALHVGGVLAIGQRAPVRQAAAIYTGLGGQLLATYRGLVDVDDDGYSPILGGGDCDDFDNTVHPGGTEIPGDGIDQNCIGGDAVVDRDPDDVGFTRVPSAIPRDSNIILITIDTVRADHFGSYGYDRDTTPRLDALAEEGVVFENAWAHAPSTRYSMPAILTGRYPLNVYYDHSVRPWPGLDRRATTIAEILRTRGFETGAITNHWYFAPQRRMNQGFDTYDNENSRLHRQDPRLGPASSSGSSSREQTDAAIAFLGDNAERRFFLWVHYYDPHLQYETHDEVRSFGEGELARYDQEILFTDLHIGRLLDDLKQRGVYDESIIVVTGDHGEGFGEHGVDQHGYHLYAAQTKVPLIIKVPGVAPRRVTTAVGHVDILPTLSNLVGGRATDEMMGQSLLAWMIGERAEDPERYAFQQVAWGAQNANDIRGAASSRCHIIHNIRPHSSWELYRIDLDPNETRNIIDTPGECQGARPALEAFLDWSDLPLDGAPTQRVLPRRPEIAHPADVDVGDELRLVGVELPEEPVRRGTPMTIRWTWEVRAPMARGWRVFAHIRGENGGRFLADHDPPRPFETWPEGKFIQYETTVTPPTSGPRGVYTIHFGVYSGATRKPLESEVVEVRPNDEALIGTVEVR